MNLCCSTALQQAGFLQQIHAVRQQTFANDEPGKVLLLDDQQTKTLAVQQARRPIEPAGPAPMISTSTSVCIGFSSGAQAMLLGCPRIAAGRSRVGCPRRADDRLRACGETLRTTFVEFAIIAAHHALARPRKSAACASAMASMATSFQSSGNAVRVIFAAVQPMLTTSWLLALVEMVWIDAGVPSRRASAASEWRAIARRPSRSSNPARRPPATAAGRGCNAS